MLFFIFFVSPVYAIIGDMACPNPTSNSENAKNPVISSETVDVANGFGTYYILNRVYLNTTLVINGYYPLDGSSYRNLSNQLSITGIYSTLSTKVYEKPWLSEFNTGVFAKVKNTKYMARGKNHSDFSTIIFGTLFVNSTYTVVVESFNGHFRVSACQYTMCMYPRTACSNESNIDAIRPWNDTKVVPCIFDKNFTYDVNADWFYFHYYQQGGTFYIYFTDSGYVTTFLASIYFGSVITHYFVAPSVCNGDLDLQYWVTPLTLRQYMLVFDARGVITDAVDCASSHMSAIKCKTQSLKPPTGVYELDGFVSQPVAQVYRRKLDLPSCDIEAWLGSPTIPSPINWERKVFTNCNFNLSSLLSLVQATSFTCNNIDASRVYGMCFGSIVIDKFAIPNGRAVDLTLGSSGYLQNFNYRIDTSATSCQLYYSRHKDNVTISRVNPSGWNRRYGFTGFAPINGKFNDHHAIFAMQCYRVPNYFCPCKQQCPDGTVNRPVISNNGQTQTYSCPKGPSQSNPADCWQYKTSISVGEHCIGIGVNEDKCSPNNGVCTCNSSENSPNYAWEGFSAASCLDSNNQCNIFANVQLQDVNSGSTCATDMQRPNTEIITDVCVNFDLYGITGQGVITEVNATYYNSWQSLLYDSSGSLYGFRDLLSNKTYMIKNCLNGRVSAAYHSSALQPALLYRNLPCSALFNDSFEYFDTFLGCVVYADNETTSSVDKCDLTIGNGLCVSFSNNTTPLRTAQSNFYALTNFEPFQPKLVNDSVQPVGGMYQIQIPTNFTIGSYEEFIQTSAPKVSIDCAQFVCGDYVACRSLLSEYGSFCENINAILLELNSLLDTTQFQVATALMAGVTLSSRLNDGLGMDVDDIQFDSVLGCVGSDCDRANTRSALEDLLFNKVKLADVGFVEAYNNCTNGQEIRDLICVQSYNGIKVLPPVLSESQISGYTTAATAASIFPPWSAAAGVPFYLNVQYRINGLGVTMDVLSQNQKMIANAFNNALGAIQEGFDATNSALAKIQNVVNANAQALNNLVLQLANKFGAISSSLQEILTRLDTIEANAQIDRLINGRLTALNAYVAQQLSDMSLIKFSAANAIEKVNECVKSQSPRINFCGDGNHILSLVQNAPYGLYFIHFSYVPTKFISVNVSPGLCIAGNRGIAPKQGYFILENDQWMFTGSGYYHPEPITDKNVVTMDRCAVNYTKAPDVFLNNSIPSLPNFEEELDQWFKNQTSVAPDLSLDLEKINVTFLDLHDEIERIQEAIKKLNDSYIDLKEIGTYEMYVKWPWYVWLLIGLAGVAVLVLLFFICCCTGCGACCFKKCGNCCEDYGGHQELVIKTSHED
ncbi:spike protein [Mouse coronavirus]|nr:spike protein [Mouse coronavirus]